jgi:hypothetical protein
MKHLSGLWHKLTVVVAVAASLSSCNRAEYAMLPKTTSYHGTAQRTVTVAPATKTTVASSEVVPVSEAPVATAPAREIAVAPALAEPTTLKSAASAPKPTKLSTIAPSKMPLVSNAVVAKATKKADQIIDKMMVKKGRETASTKEASAISGNLRIGIILILIGLLLGLIPGIRWVGGIVSLIGVIFIVLWLLDSL